jgi:outer membrane receptor protein involved in Fe transport
MLPLGFCSRGAGMIVAGLCMAAAVVAEPAPDSRKDQAEIIVTGERVRRSVKDTASSVAVVTARELEAVPATRVDDVLALTPNVQLGGGTQGPTIRGQDTTGVLQNLPAFLGGNRPRTTLIVDGRRTGYQEFVLGTQPLWDVNRIEVFRSPQTTTQGQNSIAGAILVYTNEPSFVPEYRVRLIGGNQHEREISAVASGPIVPGELAYRVAGDLHYERTSSRIADNAVGADPNHDVFGLLRFKLLATPKRLPGAQIGLTYAHSVTQAPDTVGVRPPFHDRVDPIDRYGTTRTRVDSITTNVHAEPGRDLKVDALATAGRGRFQRFAPPGFGQTISHLHDWSVETVANWSPEGPLRLIGGLSYSHSALRQSIDLTQLTGTGSFRDWQDGAGIFGEANLKLGAHATLTTGLRYQRDRQRREGALAAVPLDYDRTFHAWLPKVSLAYDFTPDVRAGLLVERAYNPGGTTVRFDTGMPDNFEAETLWDYELFGRARLGGAVTAEANFFYYDMRDAQRSNDIIIPSPGGSVGFADLFNVPKARTYGAEARVAWRASRSLSAALAIGLLDTKIVRAGGLYAAYQGKEFQRSPHFSGSAALDWRPVDRLRLSAQMRRNGPYFSDDLNNPFFRIGSATVFDGRAEWDAGKLSLFVYARNLFDKFYFRSLGFPLPPSPLPSLATLGEPRQVGAGIESRF